MCITPPQTLPYLICWLLFVFGFIINKQGWVGDKEKRRENECVRKQSVKGSTALPAKCVFCLCRLAPPSRHPWLAKLPPNWKYWVCNRTEWPRVKIIPTGPSLILRHVRHVVQSRLSGRIHPAKPMAGSQHSSKGIIPSAEGLKILVRS